MFFTDDDFEIAPLGLDDVPVFVRWVLLVFLVVVVLAITGCASPKPVEQVKRFAPAAAMIECAPLPRQTDSTLGGIYKGYVNAAQQYRDCADRHAELVEYEKRRE